MVNGIHFATPATQGKNEGETLRLTCDLTPSTQAGDSAGARDAKRKALELKTEEMRVSEPRVRHLSSNGSPQKALVYVDTYLNKDDS